jgi:membrane protein implicated in regulation of membrane protease activity
MELSIVYVWLIVGVVLMLLEAFGLPGMGMFFAGLGALTVGLLVSFDTIIPEDSLMQFIFFFATTIVWAVLLWKPLQQFKVGKKAQSYANIVGDTAYVGSSGISKKDGGEVTWSGTIMKARLDAASLPECLEAGAQVIITEITGNVLTVRPKTGN